jgi:hypothetical protein
LFSLFSIDRFPLSTVKALTESIYFTSRISLIHQPLIEIKSLWFGIGQ